MKTLRRTRGSAALAQHAECVCLVAAELLDYPSGDPDGGPRVSALLAELPDCQPAERLRAFTARWFALDEYEQQERYVTSFDLRRRTPLHLTYLTHGDTRNRGAALQQLKHALTRRGFRITSGELPDYLPLLLEFAACDPRGLHLLGSHRRSVELLRRSLVDLDDPFADVVAAVAAVLPRLDESDLAAVVDIARNGPPVEQVGLDGFAAPTPAGARR